MSADAATKRPLRADAQRNYDKIVQVAAQAFAEKGTGASLDDIACRAGVGPGTLYRHFPTRDALLAAALGDALADLGATARRLSEEPDAAKALDEWIVELARHLRTYGGLPESIATALQDPSSPLCSSCQPMTKGTATILARAKEAGAVRADVQASDLNALIGSLAWAAEQRGDSDAALRRLIKLATSGLR
ncbi:TetR/AcrR family transcriptional regulator [Gryllotalpicola daejeonensis]|uniref:TetR/AcrR family transcriptional regulator n=1 Tax=Gryllotalpicola daejeonensis TaxID=993087 RepID=A0ABP7ZKK6_9MICO